MISLKPVISVARLGVQRERTTILREVDWTVKRNEHWAILGANGSGKTSLLRALTGYLMPSSGSISVLGEEFGRSDWRELRRKIGLVSSAIRQMMCDTEPALETVVSGKYAMIDFWGRITAADRRRALQLLRQMECAHLQQRCWGVLSQGERQRVLIGRALMSRPPVLILDEPCAGLDPIAREHFLGFLDRLGRSRSAPALILVTHHIEEIMPVISHVLLLRQGAVIAQGTKKEVLVSRRLAEAFGWPVRVGRVGGRYRMLVRATRRGVV